MIQMRLSEAASVLDAPLEGRDAGFFGVTTDSRCLSRGALFVALRGPTFDGQDFIDHAAQRGAAGALVTDSGSQSGLGHRMLPEATAPSLGLPILRVSNTHVALIELAGHWRGRFSPRVVSVTGSNGKTTVKEMLAAILRLQGPVLATKGNLNNEIGVPLTLLDMDFLHQAAVIEIGANHRGEVGRPEPTHRAADRADHTVRAGPSGGLRQR